LYAPGNAYDFVGVAAELLVPSPNDQKYAVIVRPGATVEADGLKLMAWPAAGVAGD
jgi:hypothetical protein